MRQLKRLFFILSISTVVASCSPFKKAFIRNHIKFTENIFQHHSGFVLYDPETKAYIYEHNPDKYFTSLSNTKILTFYTGLVLLGDQIPAMQYMINGDSLIFWGTGDPSFLNRNVVKDSKVFNFLHGSEQSLYYSSSNYKNPRLGPGWAWDDYQYTFSAERSPFPVYGNTYTVSKSNNTNRLQIDVPYFKRYFYLGDSTSNSKPIHRKLDNNETLYSPKNTAFKQGVPFHYSDYLLTKLLSDTLKKSVTYINKKKPRSAKTLFSVPTDSLYKKMMQNSDNFIAEQLMIVASSTISDSLNTQKVIDHMQETYLYDMPDEPVWKDGSGLSRYNLMTPKTIVTLWEKIFSEVEKERLFSLLAAGGKSGTLKEYYKADQPYIFGKTGTMKNNHNLSGFLITSKGKLLIFAYMNNNYTVPSSEIKSSMERFLQEVRIKL